MSLLSVLSESTVNTLPVLLAASDLAVEPSSMLLVWGSVLFVVALVLFGLEIFIPTGGVLGILAAVAVAASVAAFFRYEPLWGTIALGIYLVLAPIAVYFGFKVWTHSPITRRLILDGEDPSFLQDPEEAMASSEDQRVRRLGELQALVGMEGRTVTALRPVGVVLLDGRRIDALAEFGIIDAGVTIEVVQVIDNQVKVRPAIAGRRPAANPGAAPPADPEPDLHRRDIAGG